MRSRLGALSRHVTKRVLVVGIVVVVVAGAAGASAWAFTGGSNANFRTAVATTGAVQQTLESTGTLQPVNTADLSFQVAGQVASVAAAVGQSVTDGQVLATLDTSSLSSAVDADQSQISAAQTKLDADEATEAADSTSTTTTTTTTTTPGGSGPTGSSAPSISAAQATLTSDQHTADTGSAQAKSDLTQATSMCGASSGSTCTAALQQVLTDQQAVAQDEQAVAQDESSLAKLLSASAAGQDRSQSSDVDSAQGDSGDASTVVSPYEIAADQATLDADEVQLSEAQASLAEGQITSPITGVVASVGVTAGQSVSADSSTDQIVVIGPQAFEVSLTVDVSDISEVTVGETAQVSVDGISGTLSGKVSQVGPPPLSSSSTDYPVVVTLPAAAQGLFDGASASVSIVVGQASDAVTVPTSAVHLLGRAALVEEVRNGKLQDVAVTLGAMGGTRTQVTSGIKAGATVVLADLSTPVPTNTTTGPGSFAGTAALTGSGFGGGAFVRRSAR